MKRRQFISAAGALAAATSVSPSDALADVTLAPPRGDEPSAPLRGDDPLGVRPDFPILRNGRTFLNCAYIAPSPRVVPEAGIAFLRQKAERPMTVGDVLSPFSAVRSQVAALINAAPEEVGFVMSTTEGENTVANNVPMAPGDNIVTDELAYPGALFALRELAKRRGVELRIVKHRDGLVTPEDLAAQVDPRTRLVSLSYVASPNGMRHNIRAIADIAHARGALLHVDAIQALGMFPVDVRADDMDSMCSGTYKWLLGGYGVAAFYIKRSVLERVPHDRFGIFSEHAQDSARRYEYSTFPVAEVHQLGAALKYLAGVDVRRIQRHTMGLTRRLETGLLGHGYRLFTPRSNEASIIAFYTSRPADVVKGALDDAKIDVTVRSDHVRASVALFNNSDDVDHLLDVTRRLAR